MWIDPAIRYRKAADPLRPGGRLAFWEAVHVFPRGGDPFFREIQEVYDEIGEGAPSWSCTSPGVYNAGALCLEAVMPVVPAVA
jgi:hypothetical protein